MSAGVKMANLIRQYATPEYKNNVPEVKEGDMIQNISEPILNYEPFMNEFVNGLVNRIALTMFTKKNAYSNPLNVFKKGKIPLGVDIQNIFTNPATGMPYEMSTNAMSKLLQVYNPDTKVEYFRRNRQWVYPVTISNDQLTAAFVSWEALEELIAQITNSLYSGNYIDEFEITKDLISQAVDQNKMITEVVGDITDETTGKAFVKAVRKLYLKMAFPSSNFNAYSKLGGKGNPVKTWTEAEDISLIITADALTEIDVDVLARAFNLDSTKLMGKIQVVDKFANENIVAVICDDAFLQIYDNLYKFTTFYNGATLTWNYYFHAWNTFAISSFANAVALLKKSEEGSEVTAISVNGLAGATKGSTVTAELSFTPASANPTLVTANCDDENVTIQRIDNKTFNITFPADLVANEVKLTFTADNGVSAVETVSFS